MDARVVAWFMAQTAEKQEALLREATARLLETPEARAVIGVHHRRRDEEIDAVLARIPREVLGMRLRDEAT